MSNHLTTAWSLDWVESLERHFGFLLRAGLGLRGGIHIDTFEYPL